MNTLEHKMLDVLRELKEKHNAISVRAEFEAEGTKLEELLRLKELCMVADLGLTLKIGGCESIRDMLEAKLVGVDYLVAPMVESAYSLRKYLQAVEKIFSTDEGEHTEILCNVETMTAIQNFDEMLEIPEIRLLDGIVIERVDLCFSLGLDETCINNEEVNNLVLDVITKAKKQNLTCTVGGGMSAHSLPFFSRLPDGYADRIETRKVCFDYIEGHRHNLGKGIMKALAFELLWLRNKLSYFDAISSLDRQRIAIIEDQYWKIIEA
jgi:4-hydroxy-2-oxoheptanedioate aldolase